MDKQYIVVISREFGSGGHEIAEMLSKKLNVNLYDRKMLDEIAMEKNMHVDQLKKHEEKPRRKLLSRRVRGYSNSPEEIIAEMQFDYIRKKADSGESFVIVGRCADTVLRDRPGMISIFVTGDKECKIKRTAKKQHPRYTEILKMSLSKFYKGNIYKRIDTRNIELAG